MFSNSKLYLFLAIFYLGIIGCASAQLTSERLYIQQENREKSEKLLLKALKVEPKNPEIPYLLGKLIYAKRKEWGKMNEMFDRALKLGEEEVILEGGTVKEYVEQSMSQLWAENFNIGVESYNQFRKLSGDERKIALKKAITSFQEAMHISPGESRTYPILATCYYQSGNSDLAKDYAAKAVMLSPGDFDVNITAGQISTKLNDNEGALIYFVKAVEIDPTNTEALRLLATLHYDLGNKKKSIETFQSAIKFETEINVRADLHFNLGVLYMQVGRFTEAEDNFILAYDLNPDDVEALVGMARTFEIAEKWSRSEKFYRELISLEPDNPEHYEGMIRISLKQGKRDEAKYYLDKSKGLDIKPVKSSTPQYPADLTVDIKFTEPSGNNYLDAEETGNIVLTIMNNGQGQAYDLKPILRIKNSIQGLVVGNYFAIDKLLPGKSTKVKTSITADQSIITGTIEFEINISERNGFDLYPPLNLTIYSKALSPPELILADIGVDDLTNGNGRIEPNEVVEATAIIQNRGQGTAKTVKVEVDYGDNVFKAGNSKMLFTLGNIGSNETREIIFSFFATRKATTNLPISLEISEKRKTYDKIIDAQLSMNKVMKKATDIVIAGKEDAPVEIMDAPVLSVDVEKNIPVTRMKNKDAFAVVIGNRDYEGDIPNVDFAVRDAEYVKEYLIKTMGYRPGNIFYYNNATLSKIKVAFKKLRRAVKKDKSDVFVYYSGHGAPDPDSKQGFFVPVDADPNYIKDTGYAVNDLYAILNNMNARSQFVVIDACFSGSSDQGMILKDISPVSIEIESSILSGKNTAIFTSSTGSQVSSWYRDKKHSLFTYYFLKALQGDGDVNQDKKLTLMEIKDYIDDKVPYMAGHLINREQTPQLITSGENKNKIVIKY